MTLYRNFQSQEEIDAQYDLTHSVADPAPLRAFYEEQGQRARESLSPRLGLRYGPSLDEHLDIFPASQAGAPVLLFIHGGYWRSKTSRDYHLAALGPSAAGMMVAVLNYSLCPKVRIDEITRQSRAALAWLWSHAKDYGGDPGRIIVVGHSAGGQQAARILETPWEQDYGLPADLVKGAMAISGLFDLRPLAFSFLAPKLMLDAVTIQRESPLFNLPDQSAPLCVSVGDQEPEEFLRQSRDFFAARQARGLPGSYFEQRETNHYTAINGLVDPDSPLMKEIKALAGL